MNLGHDFEQEVLDKLDKVAKCPNSSFGTAAIQAAQSLSAYLAKSVHNTSESPSLSHSFYEQATKTIQAMPIGDQAICKTALEHYKIYVDKPQGVVPRNPTTGYRSKS